MIFLSGWPYYWVKENKQLSGNDVFGCLPALLRSDSYENSRKSTWSLAGASYTVQKPISQPENHHYKVHFFQFCSPIMFLTDHLFILLTTVGFLTISDQTKQQTKPMSVVLVLLMLLGCTGKPKVRARAAFPCSFDTCPGMFF